MTGFQAGMGLSQLRRIEDIVEQKRRVAHTYGRLLADVPGLRTPVEKPWARNVYWMYSVVVTDEFPLTRDELMARLEQAGVETRTHFCPMNMQPFLLRQQGFHRTHCPVAEELWRRGMYLPSSTSLSESQLDSIVGAIRAAAAG
jgi:perosamine synthetase